MKVLAGISPVREADFDRILEVWEASVRATHHFVREEDITIFRPMVRAALPAIIQLVCVRDENGDAAGFVAVVHRKIEMLFIHPDARGQGIGKRLLNYAVNTFGAKELDVNEQNEQALGFYWHMGWQVAGRSELDSTGKPYPILHMRLYKERV